MPSFRIRGAQLWENHGEHAVYARTLFQFDASSRSEYIDDDMGSG
jgi:hypothetical protein